MAAHHRAQHVEGKSLRHFHSDGGRHGEFGSIHHRIDQNRAVVRERGSDSGIDIAGLFEADSPHTDGFGHVREIRILEIRADVDETGGFLLEFDESESAVIEYHHLYGQSELYET